MEQGSLADLLTLAKSGNDSKMTDMLAMMNSNGAGGQQWMWWILILLFAFGRGGNMFGGGDTGNTAATSDTFQILDRINSVATQSATQTSGLANGMCDTTYTLTNAIRNAQDATTACCCETNLNIERLNNSILRGQDTLSHQLSDCCCQSQLRMQDLATGIREQATANQFNNLQEFCSVKTKMASDHCEVLAAIKANEAAIIGYMTQEKLHALERENAALALQISQANQTSALIEALKPTTTA